MFIFGVPFTSMTQILPFVGKSASLSSASACFFRLLTHMSPVFGVGLDDTFIITGAYLRTDANLDTLERVRLTMEEVACSITTTTVTTVVAFILGKFQNLLNYLQTNVAGR